MANKHSIVKENKSGPFFVDTDCIGCDTCTSLAPYQFKLTPDLDVAYVYKQPESPTELTQTLAAIRKCPVDAIGKR